MTDADETLIALLAEQDAVFVPVRDFKQPRVANVYYARRSFPTAGVPWASNAVGMAARKSAERQLAALGDRGDLIVFKAGGRAVGVRLAEAAEARGRALVGLPDLAGGWLSVWELARHSDRAGATLDRVWVGEDVLARHPWGDPDTAPFLLVEEMLLPALCRGWVESRATMTRHVYYRLTPAGWALTDAGHTPPKPPRVKRSGPAWEHYAARLRAALDRLGTVAPPDTREIGPIPLPCSMRGVPAASTPATVPAMPTTADPDTDLECAKHTDPAEARAAVKLFRLEKGR